MNKNHKSLLRRFKKDIKLNPQDFKTHYNLGTIYADKGDYAKAIKEYKIALSINPSHAKSYFGLGSICEEQRKFTKAITYYKKAIKKNPNFADPYYNLGGIYYLYKKNYNLALRYFKKVRKLEPQAVDVLDALAEVYHDIYLNSLGRKGSSAWGNVDARTKAIYYYKKAIKKNHPQKASLYFNLGQLYYLKRDYNASILNYKKSISLKPSAKTYNELGKIYYKIGKDVQSSEMYRCSLKLNPNQPHVRREMNRFIKAAKNYAELGRIYSIEGKDAQSIKMYKRSLRLNPKQPKIRLRLEQLSHKNSIKTR